MSPLEWRKRTAHVWPPLPLNPPQRFPMLSKTGTDLFGLNPSTKLELIAIAHHPVA